MDTDAQHRCYAVMMQAHGAKPTVTEQSMFMTVSALNWPCFGAIAMPVLWLGHRMAELCTAVPDRQAYIIAACV